MQKLMVLLFFAATAWLVACNKKTAKEEDAGPLIGKWKLKEYRISPGTLVTEFTPANGDKFVEYKGDGTIIWTGDQSGDNSTSSYTVVNDSIMKVFNPNTSDTLQYSYNIDDGLLTVNPPCIEGCAYRYTRVAQ